MGNPNLSSTLGSDPIQIALTADTAVAHGAVRFPIHDPKGPKYTNSVYGDGSECKYLILLL